MTSRVWIVWYEARRADEAGPYRPTRVTVIASGSCDAYEEAARDLGSRGFHLCFPVSAEPIAVGRAASAGGPKKSTKAGRFARAVA
jgi:hypothetical protein